MHCRTRLPRASDELTASACTPTLRPFLLRASRRNRAARRTPASFGRKFRNCGWEIRNPLQLVQGILRFYGRSLDAVATSNAVAVEWFHAGVKFAVPRAFMARVVGDACGWNDPKTQIRDAIAEGADGACCSHRAPPSGHHLGMGR